ncbi:MAG: hypothetical protein ACI4SG_08395 [Oligosphaeraceae bacterium]
MPASSTSPQGGWMNAVQSSSSPSSSSAETLKVFDNRGIPLELGEKDTLASGGEGTVYTFPQNPKFLVKIYKEKTRQDIQKMRDRQQRIEDMWALSSCRQENYLAWPQMFVWNSRKELIGFAMRKVEGKSFRLFQGGPAAIRKAFPSWSRKELALTALDFVRKVRFLVFQGVLINDFNPANFLVNEKCQVSFIDCDSYQIPGGKGGPHLTHTYFRAYAAPELLNNPRLLEAPRTLHQVEFSTALIVYSLMMCGLHAYTFYAPNGNLNSTPEENLQKGRCPFSKGRAPQHLFFPQGNWDRLWSWMNYKLKNAMIQTFCDGHRNPEARATLEDLEEALQQFVLMTSQKKYNPQYSMLEPTEKKTSKWHGANKATLSPPAKFATANL